MSHELPFKLAFVAAFVFATAVAARSARVASRRHGGSVNQLANEARGLIWIRAALGIVFYVALFGWLFATQRVRSAYVEIADSIRWLAVAALLPLLAAFAWSFRVLGTNYRGGVGLYDDHELVVRGPYAIVRHPIYAAFIAIMILVFVVSANWVLGLSGLLLVSSIAVVRIPIEEHELAERFGSAWAAYARRTARLIPYVGRRER